MEGKKKKRRVGRKKEKMEGRKEGLKDRRMKVGKERRNKEKHEGSKKKDCKGKMERKEDKRDQKLIVGFSGFGFFLCVLETPLETSSKGKSFCPPSFILSFPSLFFRLLPPFLQSRPLLQCTAGLRYP